MLNPNRTRPPKFLIELIKPSHYDDDGYVIQWWRGFTPSNSLSTLYGLALDAGRRRILGDDVAIEINALDESTARVRTSRIIRNFRRNQNRGVVCLVGVQTNQFARAVDLARLFIAAGIKVVIGGFHVSGCASMLPEMPPELKEAREMGIILFAGEGEGRFDELIRAINEGREAPSYNFLADLPGLESQPLPYLLQGHVKRYIGTVGSFDTGRGCPFSCSFCTIINVQGHKSRYRTADDVEQLIRMGLAQGVDSYFITDDDFARNRNWEPILDRIIKLRREEGLKVHLILQADTASYKIPNFVKKAKHAGCRRVFLGLETINPESLADASKGQNRITEYRAMLQAWRDAGVLTYAGYILGFPRDTMETIERDIRIIQRELPIDLLEFFILTPLPGSRDHQGLYLKGTPMDTDVNRYDLEHVTTDHPLMPRAEWEAAYDRAWHLYYSPEHIETMIRRATVNGARPARLASMIFFFYASYAIEHVHPLQGGFIRRKPRCQRRPGFPQEAAIPFFLRRTGEMVKTIGSALALRWQIERIRRRVAREGYPDAHSDKAIAPALKDYSEELEMFGTSEAARAVVARARTKVAGNRSA
ncbi:MAG TPA: radical SAM protein [Candidatus Binataceae bacterium]|nr:radical SAM protein [Candidatus Binataceae bacterium]